MRVMPRTALLERFKVARALTSPRRTSPTRLDEGVPISDPSCR
jgi:hypothetical protein